MPIYSKGEQLLIKFSSTHSLITSAIMYKSCLGVLKHIFFLLSIQGVAQASSERRELKLVRWLRIFRRRSWRRQEHGRRSLELPPSITQSFYIYSHNGGSEASTVASTPRVHTMNSSLTGHFFTWLKVQVN